MLFAKARPRLESAMLIPTQKVTTMLVSWITIAFSCNVSRFATVMAHNCILVLISMLGVVVSAICWSAERPIMVILVVTARTVRALW